MAEIPQSDVLKEAKTDSLSELFSRDPESLTRANRNQIVLAMREQRTKFEASEKAEKKPKAQKVSSVGPKSTVASTSAEDLGL